MKDQLIDQMNKKSFSCMFCYSEKDYEILEKESLGTAVNKVFTSYQKLINLMDNTYEKPRS